jgi:hypothetical protein
MPLRLGLWIGKSVPHLRTPLCNWENACDVPRLYSLGQVPGLNSFQGTVR